MPDATTETQTLGSMARYFAGATRRMAAICHCQFAPCQALQLAPVLTALGFTRGIGLQLKPKLRCPQFVLIPAFSRRHLVPKTKMAFTLMFFQCFPPTLNHCGSLQPKNASLVNKKVLPALDLKNHLDKLLPINLRLLVSVGYLMS